MQQVSCDIQSLDHAVNAVRRKNLSNPAWNLTSAYLRPQYKHSTEPKAPDVVSRRTYKVLSSARKRLHSSINSNTLDIYLSFRFKSRSSYLTQIRHFLGPLHKDEISLRRRKPHRLRSNCVNYPSPPHLTKTLSNLPFTNPAPPKAQSNPALIPPRHVSPSAPPRQSPITNCQGRLQSRSPLIATAVKKSSLKTSVESALYDPPSVRNLLMFTCTDERL